MSKSKQTPQIATLRQFEFGDPLTQGTPPLMCVMAGGDVAQGLRTASELADGLQQLLRHMHMSLNFGELAFTAELKALAFLSNTIWALTSSAELAVSHSANVDDVEAGQ